MYLIKNEEEIDNVHNIIHSITQCQHYNGIEMGESDTFEMPVLDFDCSRDYQEMKGLSFSNPELKGKAIAAMKEALKLKVD